MTVKELYEIMSTMMLKEQGDYEVLVNHNSFVKQTYKLTSNYYIPVGKQEIILCKKEDVNYL